MILMNRRVRMGKSVTMISGDGDEGFSRSEAAEFSALSRYPLLLGKIALDYKDVYIEDVPSLRTINTIPLDDVVEFRFSTN